MSAVDVEPEAARFLRYRLDKAFLILDSSQGLVDAELGAALHLL